MGFKTRANFRIFEPLTFHPRPLTKTFTEKNTRFLFFFFNLIFFLFSFNTNNDNYGEN